MALLNYVANLSALESKEKNFDGTNPNDHRLIFSGDRHIYTHGVDFLQDYINGNRGLVPSFSQNNNEDTDVLRKGGWGKLIDDSSNTSTSTVWSSNKTNTVINGINQDINDRIDQYIETNDANINALLSANDAMVFKGILDHTLDLVDGTHNDPDNDLNDNVVSGQLIGNKLKDVPTSGYSAGWTYRVKEAGNYINNKVYCEAFDIVMAIADAGTDQNTINPNHWTIIQNNISGIHNLNINGGSIQIASNTTGETTFYAPNNPGTSGQFLVSTGAETKVPNWISPASLNVGSSDRVNNNLTLGVGLSYSVTKNDFYNGSEPRTINLLTTTDSVLGGIKIGYDDSKTTIGVAPTWRPSQQGGGNYAVNVDTNGKAYVNVPWMDTIRDIKIGGTSIGNKALNIIPSSEIYLSGDDSSTTDTYELSLGLLWYNIGTEEYEPGVNNPTTE